MRFNGEKVVSLRDLASKLTVALQPDQAEFLVFEFQPGSMLVAIDAEAAKRATSDVCTANAIPSPICPSLGANFAQVLSAS